MCGTIISSNSSTLKPGHRVLSIFNQTHIFGQVTEQDWLQVWVFPYPAFSLNIAYFPNTD
jgi:hypothetical protein